MNQLASFLTNIEIGQPRKHGNLKVYPLHRHNGHQRSYHTLDEAMSAQEVIVKEASEGGSVPTLVVLNKGKLPVLIVVGEELIGAKQNRVLNTTLLVPAESELPIPVSCVEQGRWRYSSATFQRSDSSSHATLRMAQTESVTRSLRSSGGYDADQRAVWGEVTRKMSSHHMASATAALHDVYSGMEDKLASYVETFKLPDAQGILVVINGQIVGVDLFDHAETFSSLSAKLARSYALDALEHERDAEAVGSDDPQEFLAAVQSAADEMYDSPGLGKDVRLTSDHVTGSGLVWGEQLIHASVFNKRK